MGEGSEAEQLIEEEIKPEAELEPKPDSQKVKPKIDINGGNMIKHRDFLTRNVHFKHVVEMD